MANSSSVNEKHDYEYDRHYFTHYLYMFVCISIVDGAAISPKDKSGWTLLHLLHSNEVLIYMFLLTVTCL